MKGDFTRFTHDPLKHFTRVLKQQGRVDLDADWNESVEIFSQLERTEARDVIGLCGVPEHSNGFRIEITADASDLTISRGRIYVDGILCSNEIDPDAEGADQPVSITGQTDLPGYSPPEGDGVFLAYVDVWERHITYIEDPEIREVALGGPDTTTRTRTISQVKLHRLGESGPLDGFECVAFPGIPITGRIEARAQLEETPTNPCVVPASAGYRGLENRLYRVEIHDDGRDSEGNLVRTPTFKWSRDNGTVLIPISSIDGDTVTLKRFGPDDVLTVKVGDWVEVAGDETELYGLSGTLAQIAPDGIDKANLEITLTEDVSAHQDEGHLKLRRWDHQATADVPLQDGALPIQGEWFELEDGVEVRFDDSADYAIGDYWVIPARTREGTILWPQEGEDPAARPRLGIHHHYCTLALVRREGGLWTERRDCRELFPPLTEIGAGCCCVRVMPGEDIQQAIDTVIGEGGGCVALCQGVHEVAGPLRVRDAQDVRLKGQGQSTVLRLSGDENGEGGIVVENGRRIEIEALFAVSDDCAALITVRHNDDWAPNQRIALRGLTLLNTAASDGETDLVCGVRIGHTEGVTIEDCRIAAEAGVVCLWGNAIPDVTGNGEGGEEAAVTLAFEDLAVDDQIRVGDTFTESGVTVTGGTFVWSNGETTSDGFAQVEASGDAGGAGQDIRLNNITLDFGLPSAYGSASLSFGFGGGNINLGVNGEILNVPSIAALNGATVGGVNVAVTFTTNAQDLGVLSFSQDTQPISSFAIGGQELWIDTVAFGGGIAEIDLRYGNGVSDLSMRGSVIRYLDYGVLSAVCEGWTIERSDIGSYAPQAWAEVGERLGAASSEGQYGGVLDALHAVWGTEAAEEEADGVALLAFLFRDSAVRDCTLGGYQGACAFWWIRGTLAGTTVNAHDGAFFAFWLHDSRLSHNRLNAGAGTAIAFAGTYRTRIDANQINGLVGLADLGFSEALQGLPYLQGALVRAYGRQGDLDRFVLFWMMTEGSVDLMELRELMAAFEEAYGSGLGGMPVTVFVAILLATMLQQQEGGSEDGIALPVIDLHVTGNEVSCSQRGVSLRNFIPFGSLRIADNRMVTLTGQAVLVDALRFFSNAHLVVFIYRAMIDLTLQWLREAGGQDNPVFEALRALLARWQEGSEGFLELDFRIEGNTIRSLRTAIESNLFELAIVGNHVTLVERQVAAALENGTVFGHVADAEGNPIPAAAVQVVGTARAVATDVDGRYTMAGLPPGTYTLQAWLAGYSAVSQQVTVGAGEQVELDFTLAELGNWFDDRHRVRKGELGISRSILVERKQASRAANPEIASIAAALETSEALDPLAATLREGAYTEPRHASLALLGAEGPLGDEAARNAAADTVAVVRGLTSDPELEQTAGPLATALRANDRTALAVLLPRFIRALNAYVDSQGILAKGVGSRICENQVIIPADVAPETQALGGIQVSVDFADLFVTVVIATYLQQLILRSEEDKSLPPPDPLLGVTETLVEDNEVIGGIGHGISVQGLAGRPDYLQDLRVRGNQVRGMAGSGIFLNEHAFVIGLAIEGNHISDCGRAAGFALAKAGIIVRSAAVCHINANHIVRCGTGVTQSGVLGADLETIYGLNFAGNEVLSNGSDQASLDDGGLRLQEVYGASVLDGNVFSFNRGIALNWANSAQAGEEALLPKLLIDGMNLYLRIAASADALFSDEQAAVHGNVFKSLGSGDLPVFKLLNLNLVSLCGNTCHATSSGPLGEIESTGRGIVNNNQLQANAETAVAIKKMGSGVIVGNAGNRPIEVRLSGTIQHGLNIPAVVIL